MAHDRAHNAQCCYHIIIHLCNTLCNKKEGKKTHRKSDEWNLLIFKVKLKFSTHKHDRYANIQFNIWIFMMDAFSNQASKVFHSISIIEFPMEGWMCLGWQKLIIFIFIMSSIFLLLVYFMSREATGHPGDRCDDEQMVCSTNAWKPVFKLKSKNEYNLSSFIIYIICMHVCVHATFHILYLFTNVMSGRVFGIWYG